MIARIKYLAAPAAPGLAAATPAAPGPATAARSTPSVLGAGNGQSDVQVAPRAT